MTIGTLEYIQTSGPYQITTTYNIYVGGAYVGRVIKGRPISPRSKRNEWYATNGTGVLVKAFDTRRDAAEALKYIADGEPAATFDGYVPIR